MDQGRAVTGNVLGDAKIDVAGFGKTKIVPSVTIRWLEVQQIELSFRPLSHRISFVFVWLSPPLRGGEPDV